VSLCGRQLDPIKTPAVQIGAFCTPAICGTGIAGLLLGSARLVLAVGLNVDVSPSQLERPYAKHRTCRCRSGLSVPASWAGALHRKVGFASRVRATGNGLHL